MKIPYNCVLKLSISLILLPPIQAVFSAEPTFGKPLWSESNKFKDYDSTEGSSDDAIPQQKIKVIEIIKPKSHDKNIQRSNKSLKFERDDYGEKMEAMIEEYHKKTEIREKNSEFLKYLNDELDIHYDQINQLNFSEVIRTLETNIDQTLENNSLRIKEVIKNYQSKPMAHDAIDADQMKEKFQKDINSLARTLNQFNPMFEKVGIGFYSHKFFRMCCAHCTPLEKDTLEVLQLKSKFFITNIKCFIYGSDNILNCGAIIKTKSINSILDFFESCCKRLLDLYTKRNGLTVGLSQMNYRESQTKKYFNELKNDYFIDFKFLEDDVEIKNKISELKKQYTTEMNTIDEKAAKDGVMKTVLGESSTMVANAGSVILTTALGQGGTLIANAGSYFSNYYNTASNQPQQQPPTNGTNNAEQKKGWFW